MAFGNGPRIVTNGLVLSLDAADQNSYVSGSTTWNDLSGNGNNGTLVNGPAFSSANGGSFVFNGSNQAVSSSNSTSLNTGNTISAFNWFYVNSTSSYQPIMSKKDVSSNFGWELANNGSTLRCTLRPSITNSNNIGAGSLSIGNWYYGGFTCDNTTIALYLNRVLVGTTSISPSITLNNTHALWLAFREDNNYYSGSIAIAQVYNRALSQAEITQNYNAQKSRFNLT
jgi:hypothetical protein